MRCAEIETGKREGEGRRNKKSGGETDSEGWEKHVVGENRHICMPTKKEVRTEGKLGRAERGTSSGSTAPPTALVWDGPFGRGHREPGVCPAVGK